LSFPTFSWWLATETSDRSIVKIVITGFNTDIEHGGVVYHVQTEDKGLDSPLILSLVYAGGAILASKRSPYKDLIASGFDEEELAKRLKRQHRLICAAITAGRLEELRRMSARAEDGVTQVETVSEETQAQELHEVSEAAATEETVQAETPAGEPVVAEAASVDDTLEVPRTSSEDTERPRKRRRAREKESAYTVYDSRGQSPMGEAKEQETGLVLTILDENEFRAGESFTIRVLVEDGSRERKPIMGVAVSVKILGTTFRPQIYSVRTERDGVAAVSTKMPHFTSGRAAVLIRAVANGETAEVRRVIHPAE
jgi:hypothetical protein